MFFKKKKEEVADQHALYQQRGSPRWGSAQFELNAGITIDGYDGEGQLGNVSITGCNMKSVTYVNMTPGETYQATIIPGEEDKITPLRLRFKLSWTKSSETIFYAGFALEKGEDDTQLKNYVESLRSRGVMPDYGNMNPDSIDG